MYNKCSMLYKQLAEQMLIERYCLKRLDERFEKDTSVFLPNDEEKETDNGLKYFSLFNHAYVERLSENDYQHLESFAKEQKKEDAEDVLRIIAKTYHKVFENGDREKFFLKINGIENYPIDSTIIFEFNDKKEFDDKGNYLQPNHEKKNNIFYNVKLQYEKLVFEKTGDYFCMVRV